MNPLVHYLKHGAAEGRDPSPKFDTQWYVGVYKKEARAPAAYAGPRPRGGLGLLHLRGGEGALRQPPVAEPHSISTMPSRRTREYTASVKPRKTNWRFAISRPFAAKAISR
jgi:hypothetical protein